MSDKKRMGVRNRWVLTGAAALLLAVGGVSAFVWHDSAPVDPAENLQIMEEKYGEAPAMPTAEEIQEKLDRLTEERDRREAERVTEKSVTDEGVTEDGEGVPDEVGPVMDEQEWQEFELLRQQLDFAQHAPSPMPSVNSHTVEAAPGN